MSALGHEQTSRHVRVMSAIPLKADIHQRGLHVRLVPEADMDALASNPYEYRLDQKRAVHATRAYQRCGR
jgi:hypothetical protein